MTLLLSGWITGIWLQIAWLTGGSPASINFLPNTSGLPESIVPSNILHQTQHPIHLPARENPSKHRSQELGPSPSSYLWFSRFQIRPRSTRTVLANSVWMTLFSWEGMGKRCTLWLSTLFWALRKVGFSSLSSPGDWFPSPPEEG